MTTLQEQLPTIVVDVWTAIVGPDLDVVTEAAEKDIDGISAWVTIAGSEGLNVVLRCQLRLARRIAMAMLALRDNELSPPDVRDAFGEFANMVAGNLKALLPPGHHLSLPVVSLETGPGRVWAGGQRCVFRCENDVLVAAIHAA